MAYLANSNAYTISIAEIPQGIQGLQGAIKSNAVAAIEYLSRYVTWKGTLDFVVRWDTQNFDGWWSEGQHGFGAYGGTGSDGRTYANTEAISGIDANGSDYDIGTWISYYSTEKLVNYGADVFIDSDIDPLEKLIPEGKHDFYSIFLHEVFHGLGAWSNSQHGGSPTAFDMLSDIENGKWHFIGPATQQYFGGSLPLAETGSRDHFSDKIPSVYKLNREYGYYNERWSLTGLELAVLKDLGYILTEDGDALLSEKYGVNKGNGTPGAITGNGAFQEGVTLSAPVVTGDPDGDALNPNYAYQWFKGSTAISGAIASTYVVPASGAGTYKVAVTYTDAQGFIATVDSSEHVVSAFNSGNGTPASITDNGAYQEDATLTAPVDTADPELVFPERDIITGITILDSTTGATQVTGNDGIIDRFVLQTNSAPSTPFKITAFNPTEDILQIPQELASGIAQRTFFGVAKVIMPDRTLTKSEQKTFKKEQKAVNKQVKSIGRTGDGFAYNQMTGQLFIDTNGRKKGFGEGGGLLAVLEDTPAIGIDNFQFL